MDWTREEVEAIVADYLHMLTQELAGQAYNKTAHRKALLPKLNGRSDGAVERRHQNVSAILLELGCPPIEGYKPLGNYQQLLFEVVEAQIAVNALFDQVALKAAEQPAAMPLLPELGRVLVDAPPLDLAAREGPLRYVVQTQGSTRDYLAREARNASLGRAGEEFVLAYERARLYALGKRQLSERVEHVALTKGDGQAQELEMTLQRWTPA